MTLAETPLVSIIMGSNSDFAVMKEAKDILEQLNIPYEMAIISAHRTPDKMVKFAKTARARGIRVIIAGAGEAAHLPGMVASLTELPVIGVPIQVGPLQGKDALLSIVQMPKGTAVATVGIGNALNAGLLAAQILGAGKSSKSNEILDRVSTYKRELCKDVLDSPIPSTTSRE